MKSGSSPGVTMDVTSPKHRPCWHCGKCVAAYRGHGHYCSAECRFWDKVDRRDGSECWLWTAYIDASGYGRFCTGGAHGDIVLAHRYLYQMLVGPVPDLMELHHLCGKRACVNSTHLELSSHRVNIRRGNSPAAANAKKTHCPAGHRYDNANTYIQASGGRRCMACNSEANKRNYEQHAPRKREQNRRHYQIRRALLGESVGSTNADKTHCKNGHSFSGKNLYVHPDGKRVCRTCARERRREQRKS